VSSEDEIKALRAAILKGAELNPTAVASTLSVIDAATRAQAAGQLQQQQGNAFIQRVLHADQAPTQTTPVSVVARATEEQGFLEQLGSTLDLAKNVLAQGKDSIIGSVPGMELAFGAIGEMLGRGGRGESTTEAVGGGLTKALAEGLSVKPLEGFTRGSRLSGGLGLAGSAMKFLGGILGEKKPSPEIGLTDVGEYADIASNVVNPKALVQQGITEGMMGWYNLAQAGSDLLAAGSTDKFLKLGEEQLKGATGPITQGYSMIANVIGSAVTGDWSEINSIGEVASKGALGGLPKLGSKLGDAVFELVHGETGKKLGSAMSGVGAAVGGVTSKAWDWLTNW
jgi:hypothetical protein